VYVNRLKQGISKTTRLAIENGSRVSIFITRSFGPLRSAPMGGKHSSHLRSAPRGGKH